MIQTTGLADGDGRRSDAGAVEARPLAAGQWSRLLGATAGWLIIAVAGVPIVFIACEVVALMVTGTWLVWCSAG